MELALILLRQFREDFFDPAGMDRRHLRKCRPATFGERDHSRPAVVSGVLAHHQTAPLEIIHHRSDIEEAGDMVRRATSPMRMPPAARSSWDSRLNWVWLIPKFSLIQFFHALLRGMRAGEQPHP